MSFVTKRERVFNEYKLYDLPARNEGKLKAYASCTDARAWSHFITDKTEHLFEIIKRNNEKCRPKYIPTEVIVDTLMMAKNTQISRLKRKIQEFERLLAAYDHLDLDAGQKAEIAKAHATIKAANKELDDMYIHLDTSGDVEGIDSEVFGTGKSRGDEISRSTVAETAQSSASEWSYIKEPTQHKTRDEQSGYEHENDENIDEIDQTKDTVFGGCNNRVKFSDTGTYAEEDSRIEELQDMIVSKDAKLNAMRNTIVVLENDVCEPYCIYAHIYTALEKIFGILRQNLKYKQYLDLLTLGRDIQHIHIKGKILYKIKVLEKFSIALIAPCNQTDRPRSCTCYRAEVLTSYDTTYAVSATESSQNIIDKKRAHLIADIIDVDEIKEALNDQSKSETESVCYLNIDECDTENKNRLLIKSLQSSYSELVTCYENLKNEKDLLYVRCQELLKVEEENESLRNSMKDYNNLWNEIEYFRRRSDNLDKLKAKYYLLLNETTNWELKYVAESEKNKIYSDDIDKLRQENMLLDKQLQESSLSHKKEINSLLFRIKEIECTNMCKEQQIKNLSLDIEKYCNEKYLRTQKKETRNQMARDRDHVEFREMCTCENIALENIDQEVNEKLEYINKLKLDAKLWQEKYDEAQNEIRHLNLRNEEFDESIHEKSNAINNLHEIVRDKLEQIEILNEELEKEKSKNVLISKEISKYQYTYGSHLSLTKEIESANNFNHGEINKIKNTKTCNSNCISNETKREYEQNISGHSRRLHPQSFQTGFDCIDDIERHKTLLNVPERENTVVKKLQHGIESYNNYKDYEMQIKSPEIKNSEEILAINKYTADITTEINKIQHDLKNKLSLLEKEEQFFIQQNSPQSSNNLTHNILSLSIHDLHDDEISCNTNVISNDILSQIKMLRDQSISTISKYDEIKEHYRKSLSLSKEEVANLKTDIVRSKDKNNGDVIFQKNIQDKSEQNEKITEELKQKNDEIKKIFIEVHKIRNSFKEKIEALETEKQKLVNDVAENPKTADIIPTLTGNEYSSSNEHKLSIENYEQNDIFTQLEALRNDSLATISKYDNVKEIYKKSLELTAQESENLKSQNTQINKLSETSEKLMIKYNKLLTEKNELDNELCTRTDELNNLKKNNHCVIQELESFKIKYELLSTEKENESNNKDAQIYELHKTNIFLENKISNLSTTINDLKNHNESLAQVCDNLNMDIEILNKKLEYKNNELNNVEKQLQYIKNEYSDQLSKTYSLEEENNGMKQHITLLEDDLQSMRLQLDSFNNIINEKKAELQNLTKKYETFTDLKTYNDKVKKENNTLQEDLKALKDANEEIKRQNDNVTTELELIKSVLKVKEAEDQIINKLREDLTDRNNTISELQMYVNNLQEEIKLLNESLNSATGNGETDISQQEIEEFGGSAQKVKAHYSQAKHNIKPEIVQLQDINKKLKLLDCKDKDIEKENGFETNYLENERENLIHNLNQLEVAVFGVSNLGNKSCAKDIINVLQKVQETYEDKNAYYEKKLQSVQSSYQLLKTKAEEAQEIAEIERQNIKNEKENYEQKLLQGERKLQDLYKQIYNKDINYEVIIKDLETKLLTQQTLIEKINESKEGHLQKLNSEIFNLMQIYNNSLADVEALQKKINDLEDYNNSQSLQINKLTNKYEEKCAEIKVLQNVVQNMQNIASTKDIESQTSFEIDKENENIQKHDIGTNTYSLSSTRDINIRTSNNNMITEHKNQSMMNKNETVFSSKKDDIAKENEKAVDIIKNKFKKLQRKTLEQLSICTITSDTVIDNLNDDFTQSISRTITADFSNAEHVSHLNNDKVIKEISNEINFIHKNTQTDDNFNIKVKNNKSAQSFMNWQSKKKFNDCDIHLPHKQFVKEDIDINLKKQNIKKLSATLRSLSDFNAKCRTSNQIEMTNQYISNKKSCESLNSVLKETVKESQYLATKQVYDNVSDYQLNLHSKVISLDGLMKANEIQHDSQKLLFDSYKMKKEYQNINMEMPNLFPYKVSSESENIYYLPTHAIRKSRSYEQMKEPIGVIDFEKTKLNIISSSTYLSRPLTSSIKNKFEKFSLLNIYEKKVKNLSKALEESKTEHDKKISAVKYQYENHIKGILNEHNKGVVSIQTLHEETLSDVIKIHDIEIENLRALSIEAMTKTEKLERENKKLKLKIELKELNQRTTKLVEVQKRKLKSHTNSSYLTKTDVEAFNVKPKGKSIISCTCAVNTNVSNVIRNIFEQVNVENKIAEQTYLKFIADKLIDGIENLTPRELSFLHLKVCQTWKTMRKKTLKEKTRSPGQDLVSSEAYPAHRHGLDLDEEIKDSLKSQVDRRKGAGKILSVEIKDRKKNKYCCACVYKSNKEALHNSKGRKP